MATIFDHYLSSVQKVNDTLREAGKEIERIFIDMLKNRDQLSLVINPEMVEACQLPWVKAAFIKHEQSPDGINYVELKSVLEKNNEWHKKTKSPMGEPDAKTLLAMVESTSIKLQGELKEVMQETRSFLKSTEIKTALIGEALSYLQDHSEKIVSAYKLGLHDTYQEEWTGRFGATKTPEMKAEEQLANPWRGGYGR